jgi:hypothetical protein
MAESPLTSIANQQKDADVTDITNPAGDYVGEYNKAQVENIKAMKDLGNLLQERQNPSPNYFSIASGFLKPTVGGSFGESLGNAAGAYGQQLEQQRQQAPAIAQMRAQLAQQNAGNIKSIGLQQATNAFIADPTNKKAIAGIATLSPDGFKSVIDLAKSAPRIKALLGGADSTEVTPFDVLVTIPDPVISGQARVLRQKYKNGEIDPEKGDQLGQQMLQLYTTSNDRRELHGALAGINAELAQAKIDKIKLENENYLSPEQKIVFQKTVQPVMQKQLDAENMINTLEAAKETVKIAPSGPIEGHWFSTIGKIAQPNNPKVIAQTSLEGLVPQIVLAMPKYSSRGSVYDEKLHAKAAGDMANPNLTVANRLAQIDRLEKSVREHIYQNQQIIDGWNTNKKVVIPTPSTGSAPSAPSAPTAPQFKVIGTEPAGAQ